VQFGIASAIDREEKEKNEICHATSELLQAPDSPVFHAHPSVQNPGNCAQICTI